MCEILLPLAWRVNFRTVIDLLYLHDAMKMQPLSKVSRQVTLTFALIIVIASGAFAQAPAPAPKPSPIPADVNVRATELPVDASVPDDPGVDKMLAAYSPKVRELDDLIGTSKGELHKTGIGGGSIGNFVSDGMRWQASQKLGQPIDLALMNGGGLRRTSINEGELRVRDIFELLPFENALVTLDLTGEQLMRMLQTVVSRREAQSGARTVYKTNAYKTSELVSATLREATGETEIDPKGIYTITTIDYLYRVGGSTYGMLREGKNMRELGITLRDAMMNYVKSETGAGRDIKPNLDGRYVFDKANSAVPEEVRP